jgi:CO dehydrogenase/acetyl-CoA synthase beta subunit
LTTRASLVFLTFHRFLLRQELDRQAIMQAARLLDRCKETRHDDVFEDIVVAADSTTTEELTATSSDGNDAVVDEVVFVDRDEEKAKWEQEQNAKESQRWSVLPAFNTVRRFAAVSGAHVHPHVENIFSFICSVNIQWRYVSCLET